MDTDLIPHVSCVMAVNRDDGFMDEAIRSVLAQEGVSFEFIIVANNCADDLWAALQNYADPRIRRFRTSIGQLTFNLNYGIDQARAPLIARMDADDICEPGRFRRQWEHFQARPELDVLGSAYTIIDAEGRASGTFRPPTADREIRHKMKLECQIAHPTVMFKRASVLRHRGYAYGVFAEDYDLWLRMRRDPLVVFGNLDEPLLRYRHHANQMTTGGSSTANFALIFPLILREFYLTGEIGFLTGLARQWFFRSAAWRLIRPLARRILRRS